MKKIVISICLYFSIQVSIFAQNIEGTWYGILDSITYFKLEIKLDNSNLKADYSTVTKWDGYWNEPVDFITFSHDTLDFCFTKVKAFVNLEHCFKGNYNDSLNIFEGNMSVPYLGIQFPLKLVRDDPKVFKYVSIYEEYRKPLVFTKTDTLKGSITKERQWWDLIYYHLYVKVNIADSTIEGSNIIKYKVLEKYKRLQIDLQQPMVIEKFLQDGKELKYTRDSNSYFVELKKDQIINSINELTVFYHGKPKVSNNPPWDAGFVWGKDSLENPLIGVACQIGGASTWWPCKDHLYDEVDSVTISVTVPENLVGVSNGNLRRIDKNKDKTKTYHWFVANPINNYCISINIGNYVTFSDIYKGIKGEMNCNYYVLDYNLEKAKVHFKQVGLTLEAFEHWFGPYPFYNDGFKLIDAPFTGMEHQGALPYANKYMNGYWGMDIFKTGWGLKFDNIIVHETGHDWFGNSITVKDNADIWVHEGFTTYMESCYVEYFFGRDAAEEYLFRLRLLVNNDNSLIKNYFVNDARIDGDVYFKGAIIIDMLRQIINNDEKWKEILHGLNPEFYHKTVVTSDIENFISNVSGIDFSSFFDQYLRTVNIPTLEYYFKNDELIFRWTNCVSNFYMPVKVYIDDHARWIYPSTNWTNDYFKCENKVLRIDPGFYVSELKE